MVYRFFTTSPFLWAHTCSSGGCSKPENVIPVIASVSNGKPSQLEFEVYGPFGELSGGADSLRTATNTPSPSTKNGIPVVKSVDLRKETSSDGMIIFQEISFQDTDGDLIRADYEIVSSTVSDLQVEGGSIDIPSVIQKKGAVISGEWGCGNESYEVTLQVTLTDKLGNQSNPVEYTMVCGSDLTSTPTNWNGIPIMPEATAGQEVMGDYQFETNVSAEEIKAYYEHEMAGLGWKLRPEMMASIPTDLAFKKGNTFVFFKVDSSGSKNTVMIHLVQ